MKQYFNATICSAIKDRISWTLFKSMKIKCMGWDVILLAAISSIYTRSQGPITTYSPICKCYASRSKHQKSHQCLAITSTEVSTEGETHRSRRSKRDGVQPPRFIRCYQELAIHAPRIFPDISIMYNTT
jgi:hypothetical protein